MLYGETDSPGTRPSNRCSLPGGRHSWGCFGMGGVTHSFRTKLDDPPSAFGFFRNSISSLLDGECVMSITSAYQAGPVEGCLLVAVLARLRTPRPIRRGCG